MSKLKKLLKRLGPGFITGAADDDPSGIATYSQTGALFGYHQLWTALFSAPFMIVLQEMAGRIGLVTGKGFASVIRAHYSKPVLYFCVSLLLLVNTINIGADLGAMASSMQLLVGLPFIFWLISIALVTLGLEIFVMYKKYARFLKYLTLSLLGYIIVAFIVRQDWLQVLQATFIPTIIFNKEYFLNVVALLGTTISPYLLFWQADEEVEEENAHHKPKSISEESRRTARQDIKNMRWDTATGMIFSNVIMFFIILTAAATLGSHGITTVATASEAAEALRPLAGPLTFLLFSIGIVGVGLLAVPVLAGSASYAMAETFGWKVGLYKKFGRAHGFYGIIIVATLIGLLINLTPIKPFQMLYYAAVLNGVISPPLIIILILASSNKTIMGEYVNSRFSKILGWGIAAIMSIAVITLIYLTFWSA